MSNDGLNHFLTWLLCLPVVVRPLLASILLDTTNRLAKLKLLSVLWTMASLRNKAVTFCCIEGVDTQLTSYFVIACCLELPLSAPLSSRGDP